MKSWKYYLPRALPPRATHEQPWLHGDQKVERVSSYRLPSNKVAVVAVGIMVTIQWIAVYMLEAAGKDVTVFFYFLTVFELLVVAVTWHLNAVQKDHARTALEYVTLPGEIGGKFKAIYRAKRGADTKYRMVLVCTRQVAWMKPKNLFQEVRDVEATEFTPTGAEAMITVEFDIPAHLPETDGRSYWCKVEWSLMILPESMFKPVAKLFTYIDPEKLQSFNVPIYRVA